jgi:VWFA-related protein
MLYAMLLMLVAQETPAIRVPVRLVTVPTLVFSADNRLIPDLRASNFRLLDEGLSQPVTVDEATAPVSLAVVIQATQDVRSYLPFIAKTRSVMDALLAGASGETAILMYGSDVSVVKPFDEAALKSIPAVGRPARMIDAGLRAVTLLAGRPATRTRVLLFIGQPMDSGSEAALAELKAQVERENIVVFALTLPLLGRAFVSDTFSLQGVSKAERGGYRVGTDLGNLVRVLSRTAGTASDTDPFSVLSAATGGTQLHFRTQRQLEDGIAAIGLQVRSAYVLSYPAPAGTPGYRAVRVEVDVPRAKVYARPGYWLAGN